MWGPVDPLLRFVVLRVLELVNLLVVKSVLVDLGAEVAGLGSRCCRLSGSGGDPGQNLPASGGRRGACLPMFSS